MEVESTKEDVGYGPILPLVLFALVLFALVVLEQSTPLHGVAMFTPHREIPLECGT